MQNFSFVLRRDVVNKQGEHPIYLLKQTGNDRLFKSTGVKVKPEQWNPSEQKVIKHTLQVELNIKLNDIKSKFNEIVSFALLNQETPTAELLKEGLQKQKRKTSGTAVFDFISEFIERNKGKKTPATIQIYEITKSHLQQYANHKGTKLTFAKFDKRFFDDFTSYLLTELHHTNNTVGKYVKTLKTFLKEATELGYNEKTDFQKFKVWKEDTDIVTLTENELDQLYNFDLSDNPMLAQIRDLFCFQLATGMRFSDIKQLTHEKIKDGEIVLYTKKTKTYLRVPLNDYSIEILERYAGQKKPLPQIHENAVNEHLKTLAQRAGLNEAVTITRYKGALKTEKTHAKHELITTHTARRTFITLSLERGMQPEQIMKITGHRSIKTMMRYVNITQQVTKQTMRSIWAKKTPLKIVNE